MAIITTKHQIYDINSEAVEDLILFDIKCGTYKHCILAKWQHSHRTEDFENSLLFELKKRLSIEIKDKDTASSGNQFCIERTGFDIGKWAEIWMMSEIN